MKYKNFIFDLDSTLARIEGIDELAKFKKVELDVMSLTEKAMSGKIPLEHVFEDRLNLVQPNRKELQLLNDLYLNTITPGAKELIGRITRSGGRVFMVTGGFEYCVQQIAKYLGIPLHRCFANRLLLSDRGEYLGFEKSIPLWKTDGKAEIVSLIKACNPGRTVCIGDGMSDWVAAQKADCFIHFGGIVDRPEVAAKADVSVKGKNLMELIPHIFSVEKKYKIAKYPSIYERPNF